ncbi:hypothetical protein AMK21_06460 [Streptomyces sp. CB00316]|nr:hypothetical protein AMK21_06460 [Streptomyces sp. CB00316]
MGISTESEGGWVAADDGRHRGGRPGLVIRDVDAGPPLRVGYRLTEVGAAMEPALKELGQWADTYLAEPEPGHRLLRAFDRC